MSAKVLFWDIETAPILAYVWGTYEQNVSLDQIHTDWHVLAWAAKWKDSKEVMYMDQRNAKDITNDKKILEGLWKLLDEADVVVTQNGIQFDAKKVNARFIEHGMKPPSPYKHVDTLRLAKKQFGFTSNKLAYMTNKLCEKYKKLDHGKFPGFSLWQECLKGNKKAWKEMETYNKHDVLALEELYGKLAPWGAGYNRNLYSDDLGWVCECGSVSWRPKGFHHTVLGKYQMYMCNGCGSRTHDKVNLLSKEEIESRKRLKNIREGDILYSKNSLESRTCKICGNTRCEALAGTQLGPKGWYKRFSCNECGHRYQWLWKKLTAEEIAETHSMCLSSKDCKKCGAKESLFKNGGYYLHSRTKKIVVRGMCKKCGLNTKTEVRNDPKNQRRPK